MARISSIQQLREGLGDVAATYSDEELLGALSKATGIPLPQAAVQFGYDTARGPWAERASSSLDSYQAGLYGVGEAVLGGTGLDAPFGRRRRANEISANISGERSRQGGIPGNWDEITGPSSAAKYVGGLALDSAPYVAEAAAGGLAGRLIIGGAETLSAAELAARASRASVAGGVAASYPSSVGDILQNQREQAGTTDLSSAAALGVPYAALNAFGLESLAARARLPRLATSALDEMQGVRGGLARAGATGLGLATSEGASEAGQEVANQLGRMAVDPNASLTDEQALKRYLDSFVGGAALGGVAGAGFGGWRRSEHYDPSPLAPVPGAEVQPDQPLDVLRLPFNPVAGTPVVFPDGTIALGSEAADSYRFDPRAADMQPQEPMGPPALPPGTVGFAPIDALNFNTDPRTGLQMPGIDFEQQFDTGGLTAEQGRMPPAPYTPERAIDTNGLSYEGQPGAAPLGYSPTGLPLALEPKGQEAAVSRQTGEPVQFSYDTGSLALAPQGPINAATNSATTVTSPTGSSLPSPISGPSTPEAAAQLAKTQKNTQDAKDMIARAKEAGMVSEKQQTTFWRAEELQKHNKLDDNQLTQVIALLLQSKYAKANQILDAAEQGTPAATTPTTKAPASEITQEVPAVEEFEVPRETTQAASHPQKAAPATIAAPNASAPAQTLAQRVKQSAERAGKLKRYEALLLCLTR